MEASRRHLGRRHLKRCCVQDGRKKYDLSGPEARKLPFGYGPHSRMTLRVSVGCVRAGRRTSADRGAAFKRGMAGFGQQLPSGNARLHVSDGWFCDYPLWRRKLAEADTVNRFKVCNPTCMETAKAYAILENMIGGSTPVSCAGFDTSLTPAWSCDGGEGAACRLIRRSESRVSGSRRTITPRVSSHLGWPSETAR